MIPVFNGSIKRFGFNPLRARRRQLFIQVNEPINDYILTFFYFNIIRAGGENCLTLSQIWRVSHGVPPFSDQDNPALLQS